MITPATPWFVARTTTLSYARVIIRCFSFQGGTHKCISKTFGSSIICNQRSFAKNMGQSFFQLKKVPVSVCYFSNEHGVGECDLWFPFPWCVNYLLCWREYFSHSCQDFFSLVAAHDKKIGIFHYPLLKNVC